MNPTRPSRIVVIAAGACGLLLGLSACGSPGTETVEQSAEATVETAPAEDLELVELQTNLDEHGREFVVLTEPAPGDVDEPTAVAAAIEFEPQGDPANLAIRYGRYSRAGLVEGLPEESVREFAAPFNVYVVTLHGVEVPVGGPPGAPPPSTTVSTTDMHVVVNAAEGTVVEALTFGDD